VCVVDRADVGDVVEDEGALEIHRPLERDLRLAASAAASRIGWTTKNDPTVTAKAAVIAAPSAESRGGEPPATARRSSAPERMYSQRTTFR
jgi:hypothetical protein